MPDFLTLKEAAVLLRLSERALYDLARQQRLPAVFLAGKWIFPRALLLRWMAREAGPEAARLEPPPILAGSHDPLLDWAVRQSGCGLAIAAGGSLAGLEALSAGRALAAATHLPDPDGGAFNEATVRDLLPGAQAVGLVWAWREQGLILPPGNPRRIAGLADLAQEGVRIIGRQSRAGSHLLLLHLLAESGIRLEALRFLPQPAMAEDEVAAAVAEGRAESGFGIRAEAVARGLDFLPLIRERFDLVARAQDWFSAALQALLAFARGAEFARRAERLSGYDIRETGQVAFRA
ncbi:helix-turn-helix transcriptional regulator [Pseudoroseomonas cervicalis]|uniref:helix-turn-helix transcriptional regulator n=1 Tax=Teichococcus cervicalis TaxID=204525 RepID=UPI00277F0441|nr:helix-turn-helix transcriptional regulator [Pseudoroseomonas cervicalis]MDQ1081229.1 putative molybdopterin biosynthesis protein [Pseudoroseomonas cervicalis]